MRSLGVEQNKLPPKQSNIVCDADNFLDTAKTIFEKYVQAADCAAYRGCFYHAGKYRFLPETKPPKPG